MKYRILCDTCDWTLTDPNSVRVYAGQEELFSQLISGETDAMTRSRSEIFNLDPDGSDEAILHAFRLSGEQVVHDAIWRLVCAECGHGLEEASFGDRVMWYMKHEGTGAIAGPMTKDEALEIADNGLIFSEDIFSPQFVTTEEVKTLIAEMRSAASVRPIMPLDPLQGGGHYVEAQKLLRRAIDTITLLSAKRVVRGAIRGGRLTLDEEE